MNKERLTAFTDAVLAIIMTILVLDLKRPSTLTWAAFWQLRSNYLAYAISFFWLGAKWYDVKRINVQSIWATLVMLFASSLFPYVTDIVSSNFTNKIAQIVYGAIVLFITFANLWMYYSVRKANPDNKKVVVHLKHHLNWMAGDVIIKLIGLVFSATIYPPAMMWSVVFTLVFLVIPNQFIHERK